MSSVFSIREVETLCNNQEIPQEVCYTDEQGNRKCLKILNFYLLVNQNGEHNKFYEMYMATPVDKYLFFVIVKYGRIGNKETEYQYIFESGDGCSDFLQIKKREKLNKGYEEIDYYKNYKQIVGSFHNKYINE